MSTGKYGMKMQVPAANQQFVLNSNDPWYNLGGLLGMMWGNNYNARGERKAEDEMRRLLYGGEIPANAISSQPLPENLSNADSVMGRNVQVPESLYNQYAATRAIGTAPVSADSADYVNANKALNAPASNIPKMQDTKVSSVNESKGMPKSSLNGQIPQRDVAAEKWDAFNRTYGDPNTENPVADRRIIGTMTDVVKNGLATMDLSKLPLTDLNRMKQLLVAEARRNGRTDYQIERAWANIAPDVEAKVQEAKDTKWGDYQNLLNQQIQSGELDNAMMTYAEMAKLDPTKTKALQYKVDRMWEPFKMQRQFDLAKNFYKKNDTSLTDKQAGNLAMYKNIHSPTEMEAMGYVSNGRGGYSLPRTSSGSGGRPRGTSSGTKAEKQAAWKDRVAWANNILGNPNATPEMKQSATAVLEAYDRAMAGDQYVVPYANVQRYLENAIGSGLLTPEQAYDWAFDDSGLGDDEARKLGMWVRENYLNNDNISEDARDEFFALGGNKTTASTEPEEKPNSEGHTGIVASLDDLAKRFHDFKLSDVAGWVKTH